MSKLGIKTFVIMIIIALGGLLIISFYLNYSIKRNFNNYIIQEKEEQVNELLNMVEDHLSQNESWTGVNELVKNFGTMSKIEFLVLDNQGNVIGSTLNLQDRHGMGRMRNGMHGMMRMRMRPNRIKDFIDNNFNKVDISPNGKKMGTFLWKIPQTQQLLTKQGQIFTRKINKALVFSAGLMALLTIIISFFFSRYLTKPLLKMNQFAHKVSDGNFNQSLSIRGKDELTELGDSLNNMTDKLSHLEKIRKKSTSDLAHELRTPLSTLKSYIEGIEDGILELNKQTVNEMKEELNRLVKLINRLGELNAAEQKLIHMKKEEINVNNILKNIVQRFENRANKNNITLEYKAEKKNITILGDKESLKTIFINLISNGFKYTPAGGEVSCWIKTKNNQAVIKIKDSGIGISSEDLPYIFERFYRADKSRSQTDGTGIGLAIVRELVIALDGNIDVKSKPNKGTIFTVKIPLAGS